MTRTILLLGPSLLLAGCGKKSVPAPEPPPPEPVAAAPAPPPEPEPEPEPAAPINNVDFSFELTRADGTVVEGRAVRLERGVDWYAEEGWSTEARDVQLSLERGSDMKDVPWTDVSQIDVSYGGKGDIDCLYDSNYTPWMYMCTLKATATAKLSDGSTWTVTNRHQWQITLSDDTQVHFYLAKLPARQQDDQAADLDSTENYQLYGALQKQVLEQAKAQAIRKVVIKS
ncbi:MAG: hypothetical protein EA397_20080 [Deltaproteobacteria bacterium]|nr:MAG: hypothetical protein EA397_20080 [Deltaproteobacteria bacterium]